MTAKQFNQSNGLKHLPKLSFSKEVRWSYIGFFKHGQEVFQVNTYGPVSIVDKAKEIPSDIKL
jgi:hypothetical protein